MTQDPAPEKTLLLKWGTIYNDWDGREYSKADAIHYIRSYGHDVS